MVLILGGKTQVSPLRFAPVDMTFTSWVSGKGKDVYGVPALCLWRCGLGVDGFADVFEGADAYGGEPVVVVGGEAVEYVEVGFVKRFGDGTHGAVADHDAVYGAEMGDFGGGSGEKGFVADVEHLAGKGLLDDGNAVLAGENEDGVAGDAVEDGVGEG